MSTPPNIQPADTTTSLVTNPTVANTGSTDTPTHLIYNSRENQNRMSKATMTAADCKLGQRFVDRTQQTQHRNAKAKRRHPAKSVTDAKTSTGGYPLRVGQQRLPTDEQYSNKDQLPKKQNCQSQRLGNRCAIRTSHTQDFPLAEVLAVGSILAVGSNCRCGPRQ